jgi:hypothetical protein
MSIALVVGGPETTNIFSLIAASLGRYALLHLLALELMPYPRQAMNFILRLPPYCSKGHLKLLQVQFSPSCGVYGKLVMTTDLIA